MHLVLCIVFGVNTLSFSMMSSSGRVIFIYYITQAFPHKFRIFQAINIVRETFAFNFPNRLFCLVTVPSTNV